MSPNAKKNKVFTKLLTAKLSVIIINYFHKQTYVCLLVSFYQYMTIDDMNIHQK